MRNKDDSSSMKHKFAEALKKRLEYTPFDKITVTEIAKDCGVNRQTFYYHFEDIYGLLNWFLKSETERILHLDDDSFSWQDSVRDLLNYLNENRKFCASAINSMGHNLLNKIFADYIEALIRKVIASYEETFAEDSELLEFNIMFYSTAVAGTLENWVLGKITTPPEKLIEYIEIIVIKNINGIIKQ